MEKNIEDAKGVVECRPYITSYFETAAYRKGYKYRRFSAEKVNK